MPYSKGETPQAVKNLPSGAQAIFVKVFNEVYGETKDDNQARQAAWHAVKQKYRKVSEGKWVRLMDHSEFVLAESPAVEGKDGLFKKRILYAGKFLDPNDPSGKSFFEVTDEHFQDIVRNFKNKVLDRVQMYNTHVQDPRNLTGEVIGVETGADPEDKKSSLYAILKPRDADAVTKIKNNEVGVSAALDNVYREHFEGKPVGTVLRHVALVGEGWIKRLGGFVPIRLAEHSVFLSEDGEDDKKAGAIFIQKEDSESEELDDLSSKARNKLSESDFAYIDSSGGRHLPINDEAHVRNAISRFNQTHFESPEKKKAAAAKIRAAAKKFGIQTDFSELEEDMPERELKDFKLGDIISHLKEERGIDVTSLQKNGELFRDMRKSLNLADTVELWDGVQAVIKAKDAEIKTRDEKISKFDAEQAVNVLLAENKILPAKKDTFVKMYLHDKSLFEEMTKDLKKGAVKLGEDGKEETIIPGSETDKKKINEEKEIEAGTKILADVGVPMRGYSKNGKKKEDDE